MKKKIILILTAALWMLSAIKPEEAKAQSFTVHSNGLLWTAQVANFGGGIILTHNQSLDFNVYKTMGRSYIYGLNFYGAQLDYRYWLSQQPLQDFFIGFSFMPTRFTNVRIHNHDPKLEKKQGTCIMPSLNLGYCWILNDRWSLDAIGGAGIAYYSYDYRHRRPIVDEETGMVISTRTKGAKFFPLNMGVNLIYIIK